MWRGSVASHGRWLCDVVVVRVVLDREAPSRLGMTSRMTPVEAGVLASGSGTGEYGC
jgi:hypothetical protein